MAPPTQPPLPFCQRVVAERRDAPKTLRELQVRAEALMGHSVGDLAAALGVMLPDNPTHAKGFVGQLVERALGADPTAFDRPDFTDLGVELKTIPIGANGLPAESTFCCSITMHQAAQADWQSSRLRLRLQRVLWVPIEAAKLGPLAQRRLGQARLWVPTAEEMAIVRADWEDLMGALGMGADVSAREGQALQIRPKAADAKARVLGSVEGGAGLTRPMGFYLRPSFTAHILGLRR